MSPPKLPPPGIDTALLLDAAGTLLYPAEPVAATYARHARAHGCVLGVAQIGVALREIMGRAAPLRRGAPDWRPYWERVVEVSTGIGAPALVDALVDHFRRAAAWRVAPGARSLCGQLRARGTKLAIISNWDHNLRPLLGELGLAPCFDTIVVSGEEGIEKPEVEIFHRACARLGVAPAASLHVGDSRRADLEGARAAGCAALLFGVEVASFDALARRLGLDPAGTMAR